MPSVPSSVRSNVPGKSAQHSTALHCTVEECLITRVVCITIHPLSPALPPPSGPIPTGLDGPRVSIRAESYTMALHTQDKSTHNQTTGVYVGDEPNCGLVPAAVRYVNDPPAARSPAGSSRGRRLRRLLAPLRTFRHTQHHHQQHQQSPRLCGCG